PGRTGKANRWLRRTVTEAPEAAPPRKTGGRKAGNRRVMRNGGHKKAVVPVAQPLLRRSIISSPKARRTVNRAPITTTAATLIASHAARSNCSNARGTVWCWNRLPNGEPRLTGDFLSRQPGLEFSE